MAKVKSGFKGERAIVIPSFVVEELQADALCRELYITDIGFYPNARYHYRKRSAEEAKQYILIYCLKGNGFLEVGARRYEVTTNSFFILSPNEAHQYGSSLENPWTIYWIHFLGEKASLFADGFCTPTAVPPSFSSRIEERLRLFEDIYMSLSRGYDMKNFYFATTAFFYFLGGIKYLGESGGEGRATYPIDMVGQTIHYMKENVHTKLTLEQLASQSNLSASHFASVFKKETGYAPIHYFNHLKIQEACHYLDFTDMKVTQVALRVGIDDPYYFSRLFVKTMGMSPSIYRSLKKG